ncbi:DUF2785 domain-containing protein [Lacticaseibacillus brantae]|uniref:DUF2785 domain-containing protein n=1 Tax=Lacticaseibacillus brantae DSM 23927 TaxID=1423727 RepID=A0A0R2B1H7_9LACO|nr:DUF2785 domain-containing protein [Lacticaseibacillus brantae]KRM72922.1 hypothetical protein FC34_GL000634 [Lacticaseibacillus brantae DSM 23927]
MADIVSDLTQTVDRLRQQVLAGEVFGTLPQKIGQLISDVKLQPATPVSLPTDAVTAVGRIRDIERRVKRSPHPQITDDELDFLVQQLASTKPAVRDKGAFFLLSDLFQMHALTAGQSQWLFKRLQAPDTMFSHITETENEAIFIRSFSVMIISSMLYGLDDDVLTTKDYEALALSLAVYMMLEKDGRGYVDQSGWAHTYTHVGNLLDELVNVKSLKRAHKFFLQVVLIEAWRRMDTPLIYGEPERIASFLTHYAAMNQFYGRSLMMSLQNWQQSLLQLRPQESITFWNQWYNRSRLLSALLLQPDLPDPIHDFIEDITEV